MVQHDSYESLVQKVSFSSPISSLYLFSFSFFFFARLSSSLAFRGKHTQANEFAGYNSKHAEAVGDTTGKAFMAELGGFVPQTGGGGRGGPPADPNAAYASGGGGPAAPPAYFAESEAAPRCQSCKQLYKTATARFCEQCGAAATPTAAPAYSAVDTTEKSSAV